jgi:hypothetical protein
MPQTQPYNHFYERMIGTEYKFAWLPETCYLTGNRIWLTKAYRMTRIITGPGESILEYRWHDKNAHIIWKLTR